jgi:hypothetical protein
MSQFSTVFFSYNGSYEQVSSSTENYRIQDSSVLRNQENGMQQLDHPYSDSVEKVYIRKITIRLLWKLFADEKKIGMFE